MKLSTYIIVSIIAIVLVLGCRGEIGGDWKPIQNDKLVEIGQQKAFAVKAALGKNLMKHLSEGGPIEALDFCTIHAIPITDSMSVNVDAEVTRVTDKPRNVNNEADHFEKESINQFKTGIKAGKQATPLLFENEKYYVTHVPIITNAMCLQCHGKYGEDIAEATTTKINDLYPFDQATGYGLNEVRGIFVVKWDKDQQ